MDKKEKISVICFLIASIAFYICAIINFMSKETGMGILYLCLGSTNLCLASTHMNNNL